MKIINISKFCRCAGNFNSDGTNDDSFLVFKDINFDDVDIHDIELSFFICEQNNTINSPDSSVNKDGLDFNLKNSTILNVEQKDNVFETDDQHLPDDSTLLNISTDLLESKILTEINSSEVEEIFKSIEKEYPNPKINEGNTSKIENIDLSNNLSNNNISEDKVLLKQSNKSLNFIDLNFEMIEKFENALQTHFSSLRNHIKSIEKLLEKSYISESEKVLILDNFSSAKTYLETIRQQYIKCRNAFNSESHRKMEIFSEFTEICELVNFFLKFIKSVITEKDQNIKKSKNTEIYMIKSNILKKLKHIEELEIQKTQTEDVKQLSCCANSTPIKSTLISTEDFYLENSSNQSIKTSESTIREIIESIQKQNYASELDFIINVPPSTPKFKVEALTIQEAVLSEKYCFVAFYKSNYICKLSRFEYKKNNDTNYKLILSSEKVLNFTTYIKKMEINSLGNLYILEYKKQKILGINILDSELKQINFLSYINLKNTLGLEEFIIDDFSIHSNNIYLVERNNSKVIVCDMNLNCKYDIAFDADVRKRLPIKIAVSKKYILLIIDCQVLICENDDSVEHDRKKLVKSSNIEMSSVPESIIFCDESNFLIKLRSSNYFRNYKIMKFEDRLDFSLTGYAEYGILMRRKCKILIFPEGQIYCIHLSEVEGLGIFKIYFTKTH